MTDKKISALTSATTPLAGTEVLPIVQSGATKQVSIANLTAGRAVSSLSYNGLTLTAASVGFTIAGGTTSKTLTLNNTLALSGTDSTTMTFPSTSATIARTDAAQTFTGDQTFSNKVFTGDAFATATADANGYNWGIVPNNEAYGDLCFRRSNAKQGNPTSGATSTRILQLTSAGANVNGTITPTGNVVQGTAATGFNFSANTPAAGMTSQLLNWYEEGTFTVSFTMGSGSVTTNASNTTASYTRVGRLVFVSGNIEINAASSPSGTMSFQLPFTMANTSQNSERFAGVCRINGFTSGNGAGFVWANSGTTAYILDYTGANPVPDSSCEVYFGFSYIAA